MANATVIKGPYGYFFPYVDENDKNKGIKLFDEVYDKYYAPGYLTDQHLEDMIAGRSIVFSIPKKSGNGSTQVKAAIVDYTSKQGKPCKIIKFEMPDQPSDESIINANAEKIATSYWSNGRTDYTKPQSVVNGLDLEHIWKTFAQAVMYGQHSIGTIKIYKQRAARGNEIVLYCLIDRTNDKCEYITEDQKKSFEAKYKKEQDERYAQEQAEMEKCKAVRDEMLKWLNDIIQNVWANDGSSVIENAEKYVANVNTPSLEDRVRGLCKSPSYKSGLKDCFERAEKSIHYDITRSNYSDPAICESIKTKLLNDIKVYVSYLKVKQVRTDLRKQLDSVGLDALTENINIDTALSLGYFPEVQKILVKYKQGASEHIISSTYLDVIDPVTLKENILNMLKIYFDFYDMPEKDRKAVAKFIAKNKLKDYYDRISNFDDVLETLIEESRDPRLTKPLLESIAGTSRANCLKDKTFYFEKTGRLRNNVIVYKPIELLEQLRSLIKIFNASSDVAILTNIELDSDESFVFQFYTFAGNENASGEFDGRRMLNLTRIYNRHFAGGDKTKKIGFWFDNSSDCEDDEDDE